VDTARSQYRSRLTALREQLEEAESFHDTGRAEALRAEIDATAKALSEAVGLGGRDRHVLSSAERARWTITKGIKSAVGKIQKGNPPLGRHLATRIRTGHVCRYDPDPDRPIRWIL
jgi:non-specific serine/threonine protein kinase